MKLNVYFYDGSMVTLTDTNFDASTLTTQMNDPQHQIIEIGGAVFNRNAFQYILPEGTEKIFPPKEGDSK